MNDLLTAASMLMTVYAFFFGLFYPEVDAAQKIVSVSMHAVDNGPAISSVKLAIRTKALPLGIASALSSLIFVPDAACLIYESGRLYAQHGLKLLHNYDAVKTCFCFVVVVSMSISVLSWYTTIRLFRKLRTLQGL